VQTKTGSEQVKQKRPVYLNLTQIRFPIPAIISILHRMSGVLLFLLLPLFLWLLSQSLHSADSFSAVQDTFASPVLRFFVWVMLSSLAYHLIAGIRHLLMDAGIGETLKGARLSSYLVLFLAIISILLLGIWLW
jgi:succinate dehydrogenase / fumarate reductase cytochrome b subunit